MLLWDGARLLGALLLIYFSWQLSLVAVQSNDAGRMPKTFKLMPDNRRTVFRIGKFSMTQSGILSLPGKAGHSSEATIEDRGYW